MMTVRLYDFMILLTHEAALLEAGNKHILAMINCADLRQCKNYVSFVFSSVGEIDCIQLQMQLNIDIRV